MRNKYKQIKSNSKESDDINNSNTNKVNFENNISKINLIKNPETEKQKEIYKNKIISKIKGYNPNLKIIRQSSYSKFDNEENDFINKLTRNNKEMKQVIK